MSKLVSIKPVIFLYDELMDIHRLTNKIGSVMIIDDIKLKGYELFFNVTDGRRVWANIGRSKMFDKSSCVEGILVEMTFAQERILDAHYGFKGEDKFFNKGYGISEEHKNKSPFHFYTCTNDKYFTDEKPSIYTLTGMLSAYEDYSFDIEPLRTYTKLLVQSKERELKQNNI